MPEAARLGDPIGHSPTMSWLLRGLLIGAGIALVGVAVVGTGGLAAAAIVGGLAAAGAGIGELMSTMSFAPKEVVGKIIKGSRNVFIRGLPAACAHVDVAACSKHSGPPKVIATGSGNVYINGMPAARLGDKTSCSAEITRGAGNVFIGGGTQQTDAIEPENLVPPLVHAALFVVGMGAALVLGGPVLAIGGLIGGTAPRLRLDQTLSDPVGLSLTRGAAGSVDARSARVILVRDPNMPDGYKILTGFPTLP